MEIITCSSRKGGVGKTTIVTLLAVEAERAGVGKVCLIDTDPMRGLDLWWRARAAEGIGMIDLSGGFDLAVQTAREAGAALLIIDTAPSADPETVGRAVAASTLVVTPVLASAHDLRAVGATVAMTKAMRKPAVFVVNRVKPRTRITADAAVALSQYGTVAPVMVSDRTGYAVAATDGRTAASLSQAVRRLWKRRRCGLTSRRGWPRRQRGKHENANPVPEDH